jgi:HD superfamily phosphohydrolase
MNQNKLKIFNDPIYGFINIPSELIFDVIEHPYFQRLRRITQMGLSNLVYPGANHTRFHHALGAMHLMQKAVEILRFKGIHISEQEDEALYLAILLHDVGHGPFSHTLENAILKEVHHEEVSLMIMRELNAEFNNQLDLAIKIFTNQYDRPFLYQLISSQIDMDRMDYLKRDSFYSGVAEGNVNSNRLIHMLNVYEDELVIEEKGIYSIEKFLIARRLMYWQAYLHKTSLVAEIMLENVLKRARTLVLNQKKLDCSANLHYFLSQEIKQTHFNHETLKKFTTLDDIDIMSALKNWQYADDFILSTLSKAIINRKLFKIKISKDKFDESFLEDLKKEVMKKYAIDEEALTYFCFDGKVKHLTYDKEFAPIKILRKDKTIVRFEKISEQMKYKAYSKPTVKYFYAFIDSL